MEKSNGYVRWIHLVPVSLTVLGIVGSILYFLGNSVLANDRESQIRDQKLQDCIHQYILPMREDIAAIKTKLGIIK